MEGDFDDILGPDDQRDYVVTETDPIEKAYNDVLEMEDKDVPELDKRKSFERLNDAYQESQKRWEAEEELKLKKEYDFRYKIAKEKLDEQKEEFERGT